MTRVLERLTIAVRTRQRPRMLGDLITSYLALDVPQGTELSFVFVENDSQLTIEPVVADFAARSGWPARAVHAPQLGIALARNAALRAAQQDGADWLAFVDDDEQVRHDWLRVLMSGVRDASAQLGGGPLRPVAPKGGCSDSEADVLAYHQKAAQVSDARKEKAARQGRRFDLATNNWIADLQALQQAGLQFDAAYNLSGGEDTDLSRRAFAAGLKLAWVPGAIVTEEVPTDRLTPAYVFDRARDQSITKLALRRKTRPQTAFLHGLSQVISKGLSGAVRVAISPVAGRYCYYRGLRALGIASGFWAGLRGQTQAHYSQVAGD
ncbi:MAG: glycosyltransferase [Pseudomonadota bacterium]